MKLIEELRDNHKGKTIWIIGTGPSLDEYPDDFFDDKICIGLSYAFVAFPKCTYTMAVHQAEPNLIKEKYPEFLKKCIFALAPKENIKIFGLIDPKNYGKEPYYFNWSGKIDGTEEDFRASLKNIFAGKSTKFAQRGTVLHFAIQSAVLMGAKKIILVGCDMKTNEFQWYSQRGKLSQFYSATNRRPGNKFASGFQEGKIKDFRFYRQGVTWLKKMLDSKVEIKQYTYTEGEKEFKEDDRKIKLQIGGARYPFFLQLGFEILDFPKIAGTNIGHDFAKSLPFEDNSVEEIIAFHSIERLSQRESAPFLWECYRILKEKDGSLLLIVTDFNWIVRSFLENGGKLDKYLLDRLYGDFWIREYFYKNCFTLPKLLIMIKAAGFRKFKLLKKSELRDMFSLKKSELKNIYQAGDIIIELYKGPDEIRQRNKELDKEGDD